MREGRGKKKVFTGAYHDMEYTQEGGGNRKKYDRQWQTRVRVRLWSIFDMQHIVPYIVLQSEFEKN